MRNRILSKCLAVIGLVTVAVVANASNSGVTYQGRILKPDGSPLQGASVQFRLQIRAPDSNNCLMYEEIQALDMRNSNGSFSLTMNDGSGTRTDSSGYGLDRIFANLNQFTFSGSSCVSGNSYIPGTGDGRLLSVLFKDETMAGWEPIPAQKINFVPFAFEAKQVQGFKADSLLRVVDSANEPMIGLSPLSNAQYTELMAVVNGTSTNYAKSNGSGFTPTAPVSFNSQRITNLAGPSAAGDAVNKSYADSNLGGVSVNTSVISALGSGDAGKVLSWNGTSWTAGSSLASQWTTYGTAIAYTGGNVGIGTTSPTKNFDLRGDMIDRVSDLTPSTEHLIASFVEHSTTKGVSLGCVPDATGTTVDHGVVRSVGGVPLSLGTSTYPAAVTILESTGSVGVGTTNPVGARFSVKSASPSSTAVSSVASTGNGFARLRESSTSSYQLQAADSTGTVNVNLDGGGVSYLNGGNVGIGTGSPVSGLHVDNGFITSGRYSAAGALVLRSASGSQTAPTALSNGLTSGIVVFRGYDGASYQDMASIGAYAADGAGVTPTSSGGSLMFNTTPAGTTSGLLRMLISSSGNVGIGTTAPATKLQVTGSLSLGNGGETCASGNFVGALRYNVGTTSVEVCNGTGWLQVASGTGGAGNINATTISNTSGGITLTTAPLSSVTVNSTTASTGYGSGALIVNGGVGADGDINAHLSINAGTTLTAGTSVYTPQIFGSSVASGTIKIDGTSSATPGNILLATNVAGGKVGIGTTAPSQALEVKGAVLTHGTGVASIASWIQGAVGGDANFVLQGNNGTASAFWMSGGNDNILRIGGNGGSEPTIGAINIPTSGNVGIGTTSPGYKLDVAGSVAVSSGNSYYASGINVLSNASNVTQVRSAGTGAVKLTVNGSTDALYAAASGNVGIGTTSPAYKLDVAGAVNAAQLLVNGTDVSASANAWTVSGANAYRSSGSVGIGTTSPLRPIDVHYPASGVIANFQTDSTSSGAYSLVDINSSAGTSTVAGLRFVGVSGGWTTGLDGGNANAYTISNSIGGTFTNPKFAITTAGNVGIGTTAPASILNLASNSTTGTMLRIDNSDVGGMQAAILSTGSVNAGGAGFLRFDAPYATPRLVISSATGNVGIGTTSPSSTLDVNGTINSASFYRLWGSAVMNRAATKVLVGDVASNGLTLAVWTNGAERMTVDSSGNVGIGTTSPTRRLEIADASNPSIRLDQNSATSYSELADYSSSQLVLSKTNAGTTIIDFNPISSDGTSASQMRFFRGTNTTGVKSVLFMKGDGTATTDGQIGVGGQPTYFNVSGGNVGIGTTSPSATLDVNGYAKLKAYSSQPVACTSTNAGAIALTHLYVGCVCNSTAWVALADGTTVCAW